MILVLLLCSASVVEYNVAREVLFNAGYGGRREANHLVVLSDRVNRSLYVKDGTEGIEQVAKLYVDEGYHDACLNSRFLADPQRVMLEYNGNLPWEELIDATALARLVCLKLAPNHVYEGSNLMGRGARQREAQAQYLKVMLAHVDGLRAMGFKVEEVSSPV